jgi:hypothetical protein
VKCYKYIINFLSFTCSVLTASEFTMSSYNCGGLSEHYDYLRAASMQKLMQERYIAEPENMSLNEKIQKLALKLTLRKMLGIWTEAKALAIDISFGTPYFLILGAKRDVNPEALAQSKCQSFCVR